MHRSRTEYTTAHEANSVTPFVLETQCKRYRIYNTSSHLTWRLQPINVLQGKSFLSWSVNLTLQTDASMTGWGACLCTQMIQGFWSKVHVVKGKKILIHSDNKNLLYSVSTNKEKQIPLLFVYKLGMQCKPKFC